MNKVDLYNVLISPILTEKTNINAEKLQQVAFKVLKSATKLQVKQAFELAFQAKVSHVAIINVKGKVKRFGRFSGKRSDYKKAYISLMPGQKFDLAFNN